MQEYNESLGAFHANKTGVVALSPMTESKTNALAEKLKIDFPLLSDSGNTYARQLDLVFTIEPEVRAIYRDKGLDLADYNGDDAWELPMTGVFLINEDRKVLHAWAQSDYTRRPAPQELLSVLEGEH